LPAWGFGPTSPFPIDSRRVGIAAAVHGVPCSCWMHDKDRRPEPDWQDPML
jgi:hypothetical protein